MLKKAFFLTVLAVVAPAVVHAGGDAPQWLQQAAAVKVPAYDKDVQAVVLVNDEQVTVNSDGRVITVRNYAVRILTHEGRAYARAGIPYLTDGGKVRELRAWLIRPTGEIKQYGKDDILDLISDPNDIYNELRVKMVSAKDAADAGAVFGYEAVSEDRSIFGEEEWEFQNRLPTLLSRFNLTLPSGWTPASVTFNYPKLEPQISGNTYTWQLQNLPPIREEPASPEVTNLAPRLAVSYVTNNGGGPLRTFANWNEVARFVSELHDPQSEPDAAVTAKARELTANAKSELDRIRAIGDFVQHLKYISIDLGVGHGGGIRPHAAPEVFAKAYGDCKDKANLMRAMLKAVGIKSYPVAIYSGDPNYVHEEWASPGQFNHCIIAIKVSDETQVATVISHPKLGRLLIFDSTDEDTLLGDLPDYEQGSFALIVAKDDGGLVRMPVTSPEANELQRLTEMTILPNGAMRAKVAERSVGQSAVEERRLFRHLSRPEYTQRIESWITRGTGGATLFKIEPVDDPAKGGFQLDLEFGSPAYAQLMQQRLMVFKPAAVSRLDSLFLTATTRQQPVVLEPYAFNEAVKINIPDGFKVDELPDPIKLETTFGSYATNCEVKDGQLTFTRKLVQRAATIPADQYNSVRSFFEKIRAAEQAPVVLARK
ncbi:MAG TPA: DUF3857 and transglutaminase domain-containing protein [Pyrinomonadaceae bacterium]|jgi:hypothetical protein|nr:DUF3857 and transglutaminase domain-containing protein [Pyrinomonadaceae bacterium]